MDTDHRLLMLAAIENAAKSDISDSELGEWIRITLKTFTLCDEALKMIEQIELLKIMSIKGPKTQQ